MNRDNASHLRRDVEKVSGSLPPLLVEAERLVVVHGRSRFDGLAALMGGH